MSKLSIALFLILSFLRGNRSFEKIFGSTTDDLSVMSYHRCIYVGGPVEGIFRPSNGLNDQPTQSTVLMTGLNELRTAVATAAASGLRIRGYGSRWSLSNVFYTNGYQVDSRGLNYAKVGMDASHVNSAYQDSRGRLVFVQSGVIVRHLNQLLRDNNLSLSTSGSGDGQTFTGAVSTDTHGSNLELGTMSGMVRAVHLLLGPEDEVLVQKDDIFSSDFASNFLDGARLITDESLFQAVVVGMGSMGMIHGMVLEAEPLFTLERQLQSVTVRRARSFIESGFRTLPDLGFVGYADKLPLGIWLRINPFAFKDDNTLALTVYRRVESTARGIERSAKSSQIVSEGSDSGSSGIRLLSNGIVYFVVSLFRPIYRFVMKIISGISVSSLSPPSQYGDLVYAVHADFFGNDGPLSEDSQVPLASLEMEISVSTDHLMNALEVMTSSIHECPFTARYILVRIAARSEPLLSPAAFGPYSAFISIPSQYQKFVFKRTRPCVDRIFADLDKEGIVYRTHMGKYHPEDAEWVVSHFGSVSVDAWKAERQKLLDTSTLRDRFASDWLEATGLHEGA